MSHSIPSRGESRNPYPTRGIHESRRNPTEDVEGFASVTEDRPRALKAKRVRQAEALRSLWRALVPANRFYTDRIDAIDLERSGGDPIALLDRLPFTTKSDLIDDQLRHPPHGTNLTYPLACYTRFSQTSGTTGHPLRWLDTPESWSWMVDNWVRVLHASGVEPEDRILFAFSFGPFLGFWTAFEAGLRLGCLCLPGGGLSSVARLRMLLDNRATVLCCTPTYAIRLAEVAGEEGIDLSESKVRRILVAGEPGGSIMATRARIERLWRGALVKDHHGMTEIGPVTYECPRGRGILHILEHAFLAEVIDPATGARVTHGESGELVLTNFGRVGSPLIRYRSGDRVRPSGKPCPCGSLDLALEGGILGRVDDMVVVRGVNIHPAALEEVVRAFPEVTEFRVEIDDRSVFTELSVEIEPTTDCSWPDHLRRQVEEALRASFHLRIPVTVVRPGSLPRFEMKARRWHRSTTSN